MRALSSVCALATAAALRVSVRAKKEKDRSVAFVEMHVVAVPVQGTCCHCEVTLNRVH